MVKYEEAKAFADQHNLPYYECSSRDSNGVIRIWRRVAEDAVLREVRWAASNLNWFAATARGGSGGGKQSAAAAAADDDSELRKIALELGHDIGVVSHAAVTLLPASPRLASQNSSNNNEMCRGMCVIS